MGNNNSFYFANNKGDTSGTILLEPNANGYQVQMAGAGGGGGGGMGSINNFLGKGGGGGGSGLYILFTFPGSLTTETIGLQYKIGKGGKGGDYQVQGNDGNDTSISFYANQNMYNIVAPGGKGGYSAVYNNGSGGDGGNLLALENQIITNIDAWSFGGGGSTGIENIFGNAGIGYRWNGTTTIPSIKFNGSPGGGPASYVNKLSDDIALSVRAGFGGGINGGLGGLGYSSQFYQTYLNTNNKWANSGGGGATGITPQIPFKNSTDYIAAGTDLAIYKTDGLGRGSGYSVTFSVVGAQISTVSANKNEYGGGGGGGGPSDISANGGDGFIRIVKL